MRDGQEEAIESHPSSSAEPPIADLIHYSGVKSERAEASYVVNFGRLSLSLHIDSNIPCSAEMKPRALTANLSASRRQATSDIGRPHRVVRGLLVKESL